VQFPHTLTWGALKAPVPQLTLAMKAIKALAQAKRALKALALWISPLQVFIYAGKSVKSGKDYWGDLDDEDVIKETDKGSSLYTAEEMLRDGDTTDEDEEDEGQESVKGSSSEPKEDDKGPTSAPEQLLSSDKLYECIS
jgi:hypothetical protein